MPPSRSRSRSRGRPDTLGPDVEAFLRSEPEIEERAAQMLRSKPPEVQRLVIARGGLAGTRNPTAVLVSRIRNAEEGLRPVLDTERAPEEIERFLIIERVEPHAAARLRRAAKHVQQAVVTRGSLAGTRDPTAVLMTRIRDAEKEAPTNEGQTSASQGADAAAAAAANPYGSDPQAYAMAYYAQYQQAYPQAVQGYAGYAGYPAAMYPGMAAYAAQTQTPTQTTGDGQTQPGGSYPQMPSGYSSVAAGYSQLAGYQMPPGYPGYMPGGYMPGAMPGYPVAPGTGPSADSQATPGASPPALCDTTASPAGADAPPKAAGDVSAPGGDAQTASTPPQAPSSFPQAYPQMSAAGYPQMPGGYPQMPNAYPQMPAGQMPSGFPGTGYPQMPSGYPQMPAGGYPQMPATGYPQMAGYTPAPAPGGAPPVSASPPGSAPEGQS